MIKRDGKLLTAEQSVRLAMLDNMDRDQLIAAIVADMRARAAGPLGHSRSVKYRRGSRGRTPQSLS